MSPIETLRGRLLLTLADHAISADEIVRAVPDDALPAIAAAVRERLAARVERLREADAMVGAGCGQ